jgi:hypothetical protein
MFDFVLLENFIIDVQDSTSRIAKKELYALISKGFYKYFCSTQLLIQ